MYFLYQYSIKTGIFEFRFCIGPMGKGWSTLNDTYIYLRFPFVKPNSISLASLANNRPEPRGEGGLYSIAMV